MHLIDNGTQGGTSIPAPAAAVGTPGYALNGAPGSGAVTVFDADMGNTLIGENVAVVTGLGLTLDRTNNAQMLAALTRAAGLGSTSLTATPGGALSAAQAGLVLVDATSANITVTLPLANAAGGKPIRYTFARIDSSGHTVSVALSGSDAVYPGGGTSAIAMPAGSILRTHSDGVSHWAAELNLSPLGVAAAGYTLIQDQKTSGTAGASLASTTWQKRDLNTKVADPTSMATLSSNTVSLPAGTYRVQASAVGILCNFHQLRFRDTTNSATVGRGIMVDSPSASNGGTISTLSGYFVASGTATYELQHYSTTGGSCGTAMSTGEVEVYATLELWKLA